jgi:sugar lactone lactonase YvrE
MNLLPVFFVTTGLMVLHGRSSVPACEPGHKPVAKISVLAGVPSGQGYRDGNVCSARFSYPNGIAVDASGHLYVADSRNNTIRKISPRGRVNTLAGRTGYTGSQDGPGFQARFNGPNGIAADGEGNILVSDAYNQTIRKIRPDGTVSTLAGKAGEAGSADGNGAEARFNGVAGLALDAVGNIYMADTYNGTIRKITPAGVVSTFAGKAGESGSIDGTLADARFNGPTGVALDQVGNMYVIDNWSCTIRKISSSGMVSTLAGSWWGYADGNGAEAQFAGPNAVVVDGSGNLFVVDSGNHAIRKVTPEGVVSTFAGLGGSYGSADGAGSAARFMSPNSLVLDASGNLYITDNLSTVRKITPAGLVSTLAGRSAQAGTADGPGSLARLKWPNGIAMDASGNLLVADQDNGTIRKIRRNGEVSTFVGTAGGWGSADGQGAEVQFAGVGFVTVDQSGIIYATDCYNHTIRRITPEGVTTTLAGSPGASGSADGQGADARFNWPNDLAVDEAGNVYVADFGNNTIRKITSSGLVSTIAGKAGEAGVVDGIGSNARFNGPAGIAVDSTGCVYVTDFAGHTIRKITPEGTVSTLAGAGGQCGSVDGVGSAARFSQPWPLDVDKAGNLFVGDCGNNTIRKISPCGQVSTIVGAPGSYSNELQGRSQSLAYPAGLMVDSTTGNLYITLPDAVLKVTFEK